LNDVLRAPAWFRYDVAMRVLIICLAVIMAGKLVGCADAPRGTSKAICTEGGQCELGICHEGVCLDPAGDADFDELINGIEVQLGTDPFESDTDGDGIDDGDEIAEHEQPSDQDGDGLYDAVESLEEDEDCDGLSDQEDGSSTAFACDDANGCTDDVCDPNQGCVHTLVEGACDDGDPCTTDDACQGALCQGTLLGFTNQVQAGDGESYQGWTLEEGSWGTAVGAKCEESPEAASGCCILVVGELCEPAGSSLIAAQIDQELWVPSDIDTDLVPHVRVTSSVGAIYPDNVAVILLTPMESSGAPLGDPLRYEVRDAPWFALSAAAALPVGTAKVRLSLRAERAGGGALAAVFDDLEVGFVGCLGEPETATSEDPE